VARLRALKATAEQAALRRMGLTATMEERSAVTTGHPRSHLSFSNVPLPTRNFVGRLEALEQLRRELLSSHRVAVHAIMGLGGIGKTQLALRYAHNHASAYAIRWIVRSEHSDSIVEDLASLARRLGLAEVATPSSNAARDAVDYLTTCAASWLLIFDNAEDASLVSTYLPPGSGHVIITSRHRSWGAIASCIDVQTLPREDSIRLLRRQDPTAPSVDANVVAEALGDLPLALEQARAYMERTGTNVVRLVALIGNELERLLREPPRTHYPASIATTWSLAMAEVARHALAHKVLRLCAYAAPDAIPRSLLRGSVTIHVSDEGNGKGSILDDAIGLLHSFSLINANADTVSLHRLVQAVTRSTDESNARTPLLALVMTLQRQLTFDEYRLATWAASQALVPHVLAVAEHAIPEGIELETVSLLLCRTGHYLSLQADFSSGLRALSLALSIQEGLWGPMSPRLLPTLNLLGDLLGTSERFPECRSALARGREIAELALAAGLLAANDVDVTRNINLLGEVAFEEHDLLAAGTLLESALELRRSNAATHPCDVATSLNNVAKVLEVSLELDKAQALYDEAIAIRRRELPPDHPHLATSLSNLGLLAKKRGKIHEAIVYQRAALDARLRWLGKLHPHVVNSRNWLAELESEVTE
jgi:hypothetical protein